MLRFHLSGGVPVWLDSHSSFWRPRSDTQVPPSNETRTKGKSYHLVSGRCWGSPWTTKQLDYERSKMVSCRSHPFDIERQYWRANGFSNFQAKPAKPSAKTVGFWNPRRPLSPRRGWCARGSLRHLLI